MSLPEHFTIIGLGGCGKTLLHRICQHDWFLENYLTDGHDLDLYTIDSATSEVIGKADSEISDYSDIFDAPDRGYKDIGDERKIELLKDHIRELKKNKTGTGRIECYKHVCLSAHASISNIKDLKTPDTIAQIKAIYGSDYVWWLEDKANGIKYENILKQNPKLELATSNGVYRMRGVAKAAFIKAINTPETQFPAFGNGHTIALIVGLGGGTGSGMFIDLARILREKGHTIWLFGVLPSALENPVEKGNAAIALTELEYLNVTSSEKLFHHIILTSLDGTGFTKIDQSFQQTAVIDFGKAFPYLFTNAFQNNNDDDIVQATSSYRGFVHGSAYTIEYPINALRTFENDYKEYLSTLSKASEIHEEICEKIDEFYEEQKSSYPDLFKDLGDEFLVNRNAVHHYRQRLLDVQELWSGDIPKLLEFETTKKILGSKDRSEHGIIAELPAHLQEINGIRDMNGLVEFASAVHRDLNGQSRFIRDGLDKLLLDSVIGKLKELKNIGGWYLKAESIKLPKIGDLIMTILCDDGSQMVGSPTTISSTLSELTVTNKQQRDTTSKVIKQYSQDIEKIEEDVKKVKSFIQDFIPSLKGDLTCYLNCISEYSSVIRFTNDYCSELNNHCSFLSEKIQRYVDKPKDAIPFIEVGDRYNKDNFPLLSSTYPFPSVSSNAVSDIIELFKKLEKAISDYYYISFLSLGHYRANRKEKKSYPKVDNLRDELSKSYRTISETISEICARFPDLTVNSLRNIDNPITDSTYTVPQVIDISGSFSVKEFYESIIDEKINSILNPLFNENGKFSGEYSLNQSEREKLYENLFALVEVDEYASIDGHISRTTMQNFMFSVNALLENEIYTILDKEHGWQSKISELKKRHDEFKKTQDRLDKEHNVITALSSLNDEIKDKCSDYRNTIQKGNEQNQNQQLPNLGVTETRLYRAKSRIDPKLMPLLHNATSLSALDSGGTEDIICGRNELIRLFKDVYKKTCDVSKLGMAESAVHSNQERGEYSWKSNALALVICSKFNTLISDIARGTSVDEIMRAIATAVNTDPMFVHVVSNPGSSRPWEIGVTLLIAGNYLENIAGFSTAIAASSLLQSYHEVKKNLLHHTLFLQEGKVILRDFLPRLEALDAAYYDLHGVIPSDPSYDRNVQAAQESTKDKIFNQYTTVDIRELIQ